VRAQAEAALQEARNRAAVAAAAAAAATAGLRFCEGAAGATTRGAACPPLLAQRLSAAEAELEEAAEAAADLARRAEATAAELEAARRGLQEARVGGGGCCQAMAVSVRIRGRQRKS
jgi:hypothetical protein